MKFSRSGGDVQISGPKDSRAMPELQKLDVMSELMVLTSFANAKNIILMAAEARGPFDEQAFRSAVKKASDTFPALASTVKEIRVGARLFLFRDFPPGVEVPVTVVEVERSSGPEASFNSLVQHLIPRLDRNWDLWHEPPLEVHVLRFQPEHHLLGFMIHHSAADAAMALRVLSETLGRYDEIVSGRASGWLSLPYVFSTGRKKASKPGKVGLRHLASQLGRDFKYRKQQPAQPRGSGKAGDFTEWHVQRILSAEDTLKIKEDLSSAGIRLVDHMVACSNFALDEWNKDRGIPPGTITSVITVNMRERFGGEQEKNYSSTIFFRSTPEARKDASNFARSLADARQKQFKRQTDLMVRRSIAMGRAFFTLFPFPIRRWVASYFLRNQKYSVAVGYLGVVWPEPKDGRPGEDSFLQNAGELEIIDVHGTGYKLAGQALINLYAYIHRRRLHLVLTVPGWLLAKDEAEAFIELLVKTVNDVRYPF
ncbi:MAG TPA: hypothetical protein VMC85_00620 [Desulfomonilaceae bacterium]|nr:hypothetical protein [Desulfomonilaceae bacterium]